MCRSPIAILLVLLAACASYGGSGLKPGQDGEADVVRVMGEPAMRWRDTDRSQQLSYPRGPWGVHSYMVFLTPDGRLERIDNVMDDKAFGRIRAGMSKDQVLRVLGPPFPGWTEYFKARDELVWEWRYCDDWSAPARFDVLFDASRGTVRSTLSQTEAQMGLCSADGDCTCGR